MPAEPDDITAAHFTAETIRSTFAAAVALSGVLWALGSVVRLIGPAPGPRLKPGELSARRASEGAESAYWRAEMAAAEGQCAGAQRAFRAGEGLRRAADDRALRGDYTGYDVRPAWRAARTELRRCRVRR